LELDQSYSWVRGGIVTEWEQKRCLGAGYISVSGFAC